MHYLSIGRKEFVTADVFACHIFAPAVDAAAPVLLPDGRASSSDVIAVTDVCSASSSSLSSSLPSYTFASPIPDAGIVEY